MGWRERVIEFELPEQGDHGALNDFIASEINPLLDRGWIVSDLRIDVPDQGVRAPCRLEVVLVPADATVTASTAP